MQKTHPHLKYSSYLKTKQKTININILLSHFAQLYNFEIVEFHLLCWFFILFFFTAKEMKTGWMTAVWKYLCHRFFHSKFHFFVLLFFCMVYLCVLVVLFSFSYFKMLSNFVCFLLSFNFVWIQTPNQNDKYKKKTKKQNDNKIKWI